jgi:hypothetical protein
MLPTVEVRWFHKGDIPETTLQRFRSWELPQDKEAVEERRDLYLYLPGNPRLGIKLRGMSIRRQNGADQLEIKQRQLEGGIVTFVPGVTGRLERWSKWVFHGESSGPQLSTILTAKDEAWVSVGKVRYMRKYKVTGDKKVLAVPLNDWPDNGCNVELTRVIVPGGQAWWTLGFEAWGEADVTMEANLMLTANYFFTWTDVGLFEEKHSYGYPSWLNVVMAHEVKR